MQPIFDILNAIADRHLNIPTLEARRSDRLDFHDVSVWRVKDALLAAYQAGLNDLTAWPATGRRDLREALERLAYDAAGDQNNPLIRDKTLESIARARAILANSPAAEAAAALARDKHPAAAEDIDHGDGATFSAQVDVAGDKGSTQPVTIDFEAERQRKAVSALLATLKAVATLRRKWRSQDEAETIDSIDYMDGLDSLELDAAIAEAESAGITPAEHDQD